MFGTGAIVVIALLVPLFLGPQLRAMFGKHHIVKLELEVVEVSRPSASGDVWNGMNQFLLMLGGGGFLGRSYVLVGWVLWS